MATRDRLRAFIDWTGQSDAEVARRLGCDASYPGKLIKDPRRLPGLHVALAIERLTIEPREDGERWPGGQIRAEEWDESSKPTPRIGTFPSAEDAEVIAAKGAA